MNTLFFSKNATVCSLSELNGLDADVTHISVSDHCGNENDTITLFFTRFTQLKEIVIGDECFMNVDQLNLIGLSKLQKVVIGMNSFTKKKNGFGKELNRRFFLRNCRSLKEVRIGDYSFSDYASAVIESTRGWEEMMDSLTEIEEHRVWQQLIPR